MEGQGGRDGGIEGRRENIERYRLSLKIGALGGRWVGGIIYYYTITVLIQ